MKYQEYYTDPASKALGLVQDFSGGLNTVTTGDKMDDSELVAIRNMSFDERGAIARRTGLSNHKDAPIESMEQAQMYFRFYKTPYLFDELVAGDGKIYVNGTLKVTGLQSERMMEAVQWYQKAYIATGNGLYEYDGEDIKKVEPYRPEPLQALYIGTNAIAPEPDKFLADGTGSTVQLTGVTFSERYGIMNQDFTLTAYHSKPAEATLEYRFEYRYPFMEAGAYHMGQDWSESKTWTTKAEGEGTMQFRVSARTKGKDVAEAQYLVPQYTIKSAADPKDAAPELAGIHTCNRILLHWDRLILYGDTTNVNTMYISHLKFSNYFPVPNALNFETTRTEAINAIVRFRDMLVAFTDTSIQALSGKSPTDYHRAVLNTSVGCIAPRGVCVMDNYIAFMSAEGIYYLKSIGFVEDKANVAQLDTKISNIVPKNRRDAVLVMHGGQVHVVLPSDKQRFRLYKMNGIWTMDESPVLDVIESAVYGNQLYHLRKNGNVIVEDTEVYSDLGHVYTASFETRYIDFGLPYHAKKLKELQLTAKSTSAGQVARVKMHLDGLKRMEDVVEWEANLVKAEEYNTFIDKIRVSGKCMRTKLTFEHDMPEYIQVLGFSIIHKLKKP